MNLDAKTARHGLKLAALIRSLTTVEEMTNAVEKAQIHGILGRLKPRDLRAHQHISAAVRARVRARGEAFRCRTFVDYIQVIEAELNAVLVEALEPDWTGDRDLTASCPDIIAPG